VTNSDDLQFISVTAKDGSVFYVVIDKKNSNYNVYFLNKVDISDLEALAKDSNVNLQLKRQHLLRHRHQRRNRTDRKEQQPKRIRRKHLFQVQCLS